jgi:hypothetical protein
LSNYQFLAYVFNSSFWQQYAINVFVFLNQEVNVGVYKSLMTLHFETVINVLVVLLVSISRGQLPEEAEMNYLENAKTVALYGVHMHPATMIVKVIQVSAYGNVSSVFIFVPLSSHINAQFPRENAQNCLVDS